jgi:hypothetical protein
MAVALFNSHSCGNGALQAAAAAAAAAMAPRAPYVGALVTEHPQRPPLSARELEMIELGGAEP